jgi:hypothetical protein
MRLVFLAHLFLTRLRLKYKKSPGPDIAAGASCNAPQNWDQWLS